jgi:prophage maintenance system killer protein/prophage antirepressor-like protein
MKKMKKDIVIYQTSGGAIELRGDVKKETIWASQSQIAEIFGIDRSVATRHINNLLASSEVSIKSNVQKMHIANSDKPVNFYSLDVILAVGYRANSGRAIEFRRWASRIIKNHLIKGYTINSIRIKKNYNEFLSAVEKVKSLLPANLKPDTESILELVKVFADTWFSLDSYDKEVFGKGKTTKKKISLKAEELFSAILEFKSELVKKSEATDIFALERSVGYIEGIIGNVMQSFGGKELYSSLEEKAAHLLYFMVKNHPFVDGNKRCGAFSFVWFLKKSGGLDVAKITPAALTALTLLIAESNPKEKDRMTSLVAMILRK